MDEIKVSVVILTYNHFRYLKQAIESVLIQDVSFDFEIIVSDDYSFDGTQDIIKKYQSNYPELIHPLFHEENIGTTRNICDAFLKCKGKYVVCLAGDDYWIDSKKLQIQFDWLEEHPDYIGVSHTVESRNNKGEKLGTYPTPKVIGQNATIDLFLKGISYSTASIMFHNIFKSERAESYINLITFTRLVEDIPLAIILLNAGKVFVMDRCMYVYRVVNESGSLNYNSSRNLIQKFEDRLTLYDIIEKFFSKKYDFSVLQSKVIINLFIWSIKTNNLTLFNKHYKRIPLKAKIISFNMFLFLPIKALLKRFLK